MSRSSRTAISSSAVSVAVAVAVAVSIRETSLPLWGRIVLAMFAGMVAGIVASLAAHALRGHPRKA